MIRLHPQPLLTGPWPPRFQKPLDCGVPARGNDARFFLSSNPVRTMNKAELVDAIAADADLSKAAAQRALDSFINNVTKALASGDTVSLIGFGSFSVTERQARTGRNPRTGEEITIEASQGVKFSAGASLKAAVQKKK
ncbi:HU family DNA-binding protein [Caldimonas thermodepolymerans]|nr:HU family DNA-binding protein [Caldimonas thermodepolymerans]UZG48584.1 HU family DNA-binding protein [Caldimonas thermodepolymerans]